MVRLLILLITFVLAGHTQAGLIANFTTGIVNDGGAIAFGQDDDDWSLIAAPEGIALGSVKVVPPAGSSFFSMEPDARWLSPSIETNYDAPWGNYTYQFLFNLDRDVLVNLALSGQLAADNRLIEMRLNGATFLVGPNISGVGCPATGCEEFKSPTAPISFLLMNDALFLDGVNAFQVTIENQGPTFTNPTSILLSGSVSGTYVPVPVPATILLVVLGLIGLCGAHVRRSFRVDPFGERRTMVKFLGALTRQSRRVLAAAQSTLEPSVASPKISGVYCGVDTR